MAIMGVILIHILALAAGVGAGILFIKMNDQKRDTELLIQRNLKEIRNKESKND